jgi:hypothetical protein
MSPHGAALVWRLLNPNPTKPSRDGAAEDAAQARTSQSKKQKGSFLGAFFQEKVQYGPAG